ncbi:NUDIX hydrolase [Teichococcus vastitatis]|uniref:NUDIX hydrolase n=1 Tax=Teichococcus vastitatis TaxID=2307076 RepID=A0ABS9W268_9PROT|nr:NUDIX hydrolase [Pseudoroseomonas vastitatis]MCI0753389.1 NUDIX hydrolase [Pseudoroseomonas vastitatis]
MNSAPALSREYPDRPWIGIGVILFRGEDVLLVRRARPPRLGEWSIPGGAQHLGETVDEAARRELLEETGVTAGPLHIALAVDAISQDEEGRTRFHYTILDFAARWLAGTPRAGDDASAAAWFTPDQVAGLSLRPEVLQAIAEGRRRLPD